MAHYVLRAGQMTEYGVGGTIYDSKGNELSCHFSSNLGWLEQDLLNDIDFDYDNDTYTKNW